LWLRNLWGISFFPSLISLTNFIFSSSGWHEHHRDRDVYEEATFVLAKCIPLSILHTVNVGEALGLYYALEWLSDMRFDNVDFALDSKTTVDTFNHTRPDIIEFGLVISACRSMFRSKFTNSKVEFNRRQANEVAHALTGVAALLASLTIYSIVPRCIEHLINEML